MTYIKTTPQKKGHEHLEQNPQKKWAASVYLFKKQGSLYYQLK